MASIFPTGLDNFLTNRANQAGQKVDAGDINNLADAINKIEAFLLPIASLTLAVDTSAKDGVADLTLMSSIPQNYRHLKIIGQARSDYASGNNDNLRIRFNDDATMPGHYDAMYLSNYDNARAHQSGFVAASSGGSPTVSIADFDPHNVGTADISSFSNTGPPNNIRLCNIPGAGSSPAAPAGSCTYFECIIPFYASTAFHKGVFTQYVHMRGPQMGGSAAVDTGPSQGIHGGRWFGSDGATPTAITKIALNISLGNNLRAGSSFDLYAY